MQDAQVRALLHGSWRNQPTRFLPGLEAGLAKVTTARTTGLHQGRRVAVQWGGEEGRVRFLSFDDMELDQFSCNM